MSSHKDHLINRCNALREQLWDCGRELQPPAQAMQTGIDFVLATAGWMRVTAPYRKSKPRRKWAAVPRVLVRYLRWQLAD